MLINSITGPLTGEKGAEMLWEPTPLLHSGHFSSWKWFTGLKNACFYCCGKVHLSVKGQKATKQRLSLKEWLLCFYKKTLGRKGWWPILARVGCCMWDMRVPTAPWDRERALRWIAVIKPSLFLRNANRGGAFKASDGEDFPHTKETDRSGMNGVGKR